MFTRDDASWFSNTVGALYGARSTAEFTRLAISAVHERFHLIATGCEEAGIGASSYVLHGVRSETPVPPDVAAYLHDHPLAPLLNTDRLPRLFHMRKHVSISRWYQTDHYNGICRPMGVRDQLELVGQTRPTTTFLLGLNRDSIFSEKECAMVRLLQPHVEAVLRRVHPATKSVQRATPLNIDLSPGLKPLFLNAAQRTLLRSYFPRWRESSTLPLELHEWLVNLLREMQQKLLWKPLHAFAIESARGRLLVRCFPGQKGRPMQLFLAETPAVPDYFRFLGFGLTSRECEVLHWLAEGKRDSEIATLLCIAPKTVNKHVEHVIEKLHVENRGSAVSAAHDYLSFK